MQMTNRTKAARRQRRKARNATRHAPTTTGITTPPASVDPIQERCSSVGSRWSASHRLIPSSQPANPPIGSSSFVRMRPRPAMRAKRAAYPSTTAARKTTTGRSAPTRSANDSAHESVLGSSSGTAAAVVCRDRSAFGLDDAEAGGALSTVPTSAVPPTAAMPAGLPTRDRGQPYGWPMGRTPVRQARVSQRCRS